MKLENKHIVITGATQGIGLEIVKQLYPQNEITIIARPSKRLDELKTNFERLKILECNLSDNQSVTTTALKLTANKDKKIDLLINNAAIQCTPQFLDPKFNYETIEQEITVNFIAPCLLIYHCLPALMQKSATTIINVNSGLGLVPKTNSAIYCATKGAINIFSQALRSQLEKTNIRVVQIFLPLVNTNMTKGRGVNKLSAKEAALEIIKGLSNSQNDIDIGKVKILRFINRLMPTLAQKIMKRV